VSYAVTGNKRIKGTTEGCFGAEACTNQGPEGTHLEETPVNVINIRTIRAVNVVKIGVYVVSSNSTCLVVVVISGVQDNNVVFVQRFAGSAETIGYLVCDRQSTRACSDGSWRRGLGKD
jgi:hypothetical protein